MQVALSVAKDEGDAANDEGDTLAGAQQRAANVKAFIKDTYGFEPLSESSAYITYLISRSDEERLPEMLKNLESNTAALEISDIQVRRWPLFMRFVLSKGFLTSSARTALVWFRSVCTDNAYKATVFGVALCDCNVKRQIHAFSALMQCLCCRLR